MTVGGLVDARCVQGSIKGVKAFTHVLTFFVFFCLATTGSADYRLMSTFFLNVIFLKTIVFCCINAMLLIYIYIYICRYRYMTSSHQKNMEFRDIFLQHSWRVKAFKLKTYDS